MTAIALEDILEKDWQRDVVKLAKTLGWTIYHTYNSQRSAHGFPDLVLVRDRVIYLELKREKTKLTEDQKRWVRQLIEAGAEVYVARPRDLQAVADVLRCRRVPYDFGAWGAVVKTAVDLREHTQAEAA